MGLGEGGGEGWGGEGGQSFMLRLCNLTSARLHMVFSPSRRTQLWLWLPRMFHLSTHTPGHLQTFTP